MTLLTNLLEYLEHSATLFPDKAAFTDETETVTFAELVGLGREVGAAVHAKVEQTRLPVAVLTTHKVADVVAFIGTLYAGCFYVPLDGFAPKEHVRARLEAISPAMTLDADCVMQLPRATLSDAALDRIRDGALSSDPAYAIFTSGSTGVPKAALISHGGVVNLIEWMGETFGFSKRTVFAGQCPFYFDSSVQELYSTLKHGASTRLFPKKHFISSLKALRAVSETGANVMPWAAAAIKMIANSGALERYAPVGVEDVIFGGENMPVAVLEKWQNAMPNARFTNVYGPTETTVDCSFYTVRRDLSDDKSVPIGFPCRDTELLLLSEDGRPAVCGETGEIYVRGAGVGLGYYNNASRTAESFVQNPLHSNYRDIVYRTGDLAKLNEFGELVFISRADNQVKHMGSRVELGEVESTAASLDGIGLVCCAYDKENSKILLFYEGAIAENRLAAEMAARLPRYMQPNVIIKVGEMPKLPNGKIDRVRVRKECYDGDNKL
ncbi:MAG: AMP-binding protein [Oscillospiraceae bacterium]|nr:AMP-binding protein [Oscillospiraceae bacterium]